MRDAILPPNLLTYARLAATPVVAWFLLHGRCELALWLMIAGGLTDAADGFLARRFGWKSRLGAYLDPVADKLMMTTLYVVFALAGLAPNWLAWLVVGRDVLILAMVAIAALAAQVREFPPRVAGKVSTLLQMVLTVMLAVRCAYPGFFQPWLEVALWGTAAVTVYSGLDYVIYATRAARKH